MRRKLGETIYRVRYTQVGNKKVSNIFLNTHGTPYQCELDFDTMTYRIINRKHNRVISSTELDEMKPAASKAYLSRQAKRAIKRLGVDTGYEIRDVIKDCE